MLKPEICIICKQRDYAEKIAKYDSITPEQKLLLQKSMEQFALQEQWVCPVYSLKWVNGKNSSMVSKNSDVPEKCPYSLEQVVGGTPQ